MPRCMWCGNEIAHQQNMRLVPHVRNQYGIYHNDCWKRVKGGRSNAKRVAEAE